VTTPSAEKVVQFMTIALNHVVTLTAFGYKVLGLKL
jgi:hypothetical protein